MPCHLIPKIECVVLLFKAKGGNASLEPLVGLLSSSLASVGCKGVYDHSKRYTGLTAVAIGAVGEQSTSSKALCYQFRVSVTLDKVAGCCDL